MSYQLPFREATAWEADGYFRDYTNNVKWGIGIAAEAFVGLTFLLLKDNPVAVGGASSLIITIASGLMNKVEKSRHNFHDKFWMDPYRSNQNHLEKVNVSNHKN